MDVRLQTVSLSEIGATVGSPPSTRFAASVRRMGVIQPVLLAERTADSGEIEYVIVDGNRRIHAARKAKLREIPAVVIAGIEAEERAQLTLVANGFRSPNYLTEFWAIKALERTGFSLDEVSRISGMSESVVSTRRRLSYLQRDLFIGLRNGRVSQSNAITIAKMDRQDQEGLANIYARKGKVLKRDVDQHLAAINKRSISHRVATVTTDHPQSVTAAIQFAQAGSKRDSAGSTVYLESVPVVNSPSEAEPHSDLSVHTPHSQVRKNEHPLSEQNSAATNPSPFIGSQVGAFGQTAAITNPHEQPVPDEEMPHVIPTPASRVVNHMRNAVIAAQLLDFDKAEFLEMAARIWDETISQQTEKQFMRNQTPKEPFPDLAAHKWDTGES